MKTQIITLAAHDDLISVRDRMSWAKAPRILLVWPPKEQVRLQPLDLRILQQRARELGAELALVARGSGVRRDAAAFGIPVFHSTIEAQRSPWRSRNRGIRRHLLPIHVRLGKLRELRRGARPPQTALTSSSAVRLGSFVAAVIAVFAIASIFIPRATIVVSPEMKKQTATITVDVAVPGASGPSQSGLSAATITIPVRGEKSMPVVTRSGVPTARATGSAQLQNLSGAPILVPGGTVLYSLTPELKRYVTLQDTPLGAGTDGTASVKIEALNVGAEGNLPAASLAGLEGSLSASVAVSNPDPITGGASEQQSVPSKEDRDRLRMDLQKTLETQAQQALESALQEGDLLLPGSLVLKSIEREEFDPPEGTAASILTLALDTTYEARYVRAADLRALASIALDSALPSDFTPREGSLRVQVNQMTEASAGQPARLQIALERSISPRIDTTKAIQLVRGIPLRRAGRILEAALTLASPPEIRLSPPWWPWMPLIPFRIDILSS